MISFRGCFIVAVTIASIGTALALTTDEKDAFFTGTGAYTWSSTASYTDYTSLSSSMTITDITYTEHKTGTVNYYHYFEYNGIPDYQYVVDSDGTSTYVDWTTNGGNKKTISSQSFTKCITQNPVDAGSSSCTEVDGLVGITINGTPLWTWHTSSYADAVATETMDSCGGHPNPNGQYHYHGFNSEHFSSISSSYSGCFKNFDEDACPAPLIGVALDGFPIYGPQKCETCVSENADGTCDTFSTTASGLFTSSDLTNGTRTVDGTHDGDSDKTSGSIEYRLHTDKPYSIDCFRGSTAPLYQCLNGDEVTKRVDENLVLEEETAVDEVEEVEEEALESRLRALLSSLLNKRGKE